jgi:hypothetical protein
MAINQRLRTEVDAKLTELRRFRRDLDAKAKRYRAVAGERGLDLGDFAAP